MGIFGVKKLNDEIENLKVQKENLENDISKLKKSKSELQEKIFELEENVGSLKNTENELNKRIANRQDFFVESELKSIDVQTGLEFEVYIGEMFSKLGYKSVVTKASQDSGGDVLAEKDEKSYIIQCKNYSSTVGNKAVQEVYSAKGIYKADVAIVITNNYYTEQAKKEANVLGVELWDRDKLRQLLYIIYDFDVSNIDNSKLLNKNFKQVQSQENDDIDDVDEFLMEAIELAVSMGQISPSMIQRKFKLGYARAGRIIDQMEERGIISGYQGSKPRQVLITKEEWEEMQELGEGS